MQRKITIAKRFELNDKIGVGGFGEVYRATDKQTKNLVALKMENRASTVPMLLYEAKILQTLQGVESVP